eukprot:8721716-Pyramimonas_sp.AAC.1
MAVNVLMAAMRASSDAWARAAPLIRECLVAGFDEKGDLKEDASEHIAGIASAFDAFRKLKAPGLKELEDLLE